MLCPYWNYKGGNRHNSSDFQVVICSECFGFWVLGLKTSTYQTLQRFRGLAHGIFCVKTFLPGRDDARGQERDYVPLDEVLYEPPLSFSVQGLGDLGLLVARLANGIPGYREG